MTMSQLVWPYRQVKVWPPVRPFYTSPHVVAPPLLVRVCNWTRVSVKARNRQGEVLVPHRYVFTLCYIFMYRLTDFLGIATRLKSLRPVSSSHWQGGRGRCRGCERWKFWVLDICLFSATGSLQPSSNSHHLFFSLSLSHPTADDTRAVNIASYLLRLQPPTVVWFVRRKVECLAFYLPA